MDIDSSENPKAELLERAAAQHQFFLASEPPARKKYLANLLTHFAQNDLKLTKVGLKETLTKQDEFNDYFKLRLMQLVCNDFTPADYEEQSLKERVFNFLNDPLLTVQALEQIEFDRAVQASLDSYAGADLATALGNLAKAPDLMEQ